MASQIANANVQPQNLQFTYWTSDCTSSPFQHMRSHVLHSCFPPYEQLRVCQSQFLRAGLAGSSGGSDLVCGSNLLHLTGVTQLLHVARSLCGGYMVTKAGAANSARLLTHHNKRWFDKAGIMPVNTRVAWHKRSCCTHTFTVSMVQLRLNFVH